MQAAVTQKHSQQGLVTLQPVSSALLIVVWTPGLTKKEKRECYCISFIYNISKLVELVWNYMPAVPSHFFNSLTLFNM